MSIFEGTERKRENWLGSASNRKEKGEEIKITNGRVLVCLESKVEHSLYRRESKIG